MDVVLKRMAICQITSDPLVPQPRVSRRTLLKGSAAAAVAIGVAALPSACAAVEQPVPGTSSGPLCKGKVIDCHAHLNHRSRSTWEADDRKLIDAADKLGIDQLCCSILTPRQPATADGFRECNRWTADGMRRLNNRLRHLPGLYEQAARPDMKRIYHAENMLFIDEAEAGMSREACVRALQAEGVQAKAHTYTLQHKLPLYSEATWWHHKPIIPDLPGSEQANRTAIALPLFTAEVPELVDQYAKAFEKVWTHRKELGKG